MAEMLDRAANRIKMHTNWGAYYT